MHGDAGLEAVDHAAEAVLPLALADPAVLQRAGESLLAACADGAAMVRGPLRPACCARRPLQGLGRDGQLPSPAAAGDAPAPKPACCAAHRACRARCEWQGQRRFAAAFDEI